MYVPLTTSYGEQGVTHTKVLSTDPDTPFKSCKKKKDDFDYSGVPSTQTSMSK